MAKLTTAIVLLLALAACNAQNVGHGLGATAPVYVPPPQEPIMIIGPDGTVICNQTGNVVFCY